MSGILLSHNREVMRAPVNPLDKSTVVSIFPIPIRETKITLSPGKFVVPPGTVKEPGILVVGTSSWWRELDESQPLLEIPVSSVQIADSIVKDYLVGMLLCDMESKMPGLFFVPGEITSKQAVAMHGDKIHSAKVKQDEWFRALVNMADNLWARTNGNPLAIDDIMRIAARELGFNDKPWLKNVSQSIELIPCVACSTLINSEVVICPNCKVVVNSKKFTELGLKFAG